jgi:hypothetical protein
LRYPHANANTRLEDGDSVSFLAVIAARYKLVEADTPENDYAVLVRTWDPRDPTVPIPATKHDTKTILGLVESISILMLSNFTSIHPTHVADCALGANHTIALIPMSDASHRF